MSGFDAEKVRQVAIALQTNERYIEKDWHLVRALGVISSVNVEGVVPTFSGGTSLARAWQLIHRFSEDIDFKVTVAGGSVREQRDRRRTYREAVLEAMQKAGFVLDGPPTVGNESLFFRASFHYGPVFPEAGGIRPGLRVEMTFSGTHIAPKTSPVQSLYGQSLKAAPELASLSCVDPVETTADKICALSWRAAVRDRSDPAKDEPEVVRHLHDLAALAPRYGGVPDLQPLTLRLLDIDAKRGRMEDGRKMLGAMLPKIMGDPEWKKEYERYVSAVSFGPDADRISYEKAVAACEDLVRKIL